MNAYLDEIRQVISEVGSDVCKIDSYYKQVSWSLSKGQWEALSKDQKKVLVSKLTQRN